MVGFSQSRKTIYPDTDMKKKVVDMSKPFRLPKGVARRMLARVTPVLRPSTADYLLNAKQVPVKKLSPKTVAKVAFELAREFSLQFDRFQPMLPARTAKVSQILLKRFPSLAESTDFFNANDPLTGMEVLIPAGDGYHHGAENFSSTACLVFGHDGTFTFVEQLAPVNPHGGGERLHMQALTQAGLAKVVKRFPDLGWVLTCRFFPQMIHCAANDIKFVCRHMEKVEALAEGVMMKCAFRG